MPARTNNRYYQGWSTCSRCYGQYPLSQMGWQQGALICYEQCWDNPLQLYPGQRDARIARILSTQPPGGEPQIDPKLVQANRDPWLY